MWLAFFRVLPDSERDAAHSKWTRKGVSIQHAIRKYECPVKQADLVLNARTVLEYVVTWDGKLERIAGLSRQSTLSESGVEDPHSLLTSLGLSK